ncbi:IclR family transcriptional regulator C-terminal domain-containing protein [Spirochaetia bacterium 38H-sp]|uniref:IclR family transcriptional regulator C-terminal domain-containing protein n=1 Tax=Rarispira pelagica TaxID=3141764 RepID=A0ABU9UD56_9SPIR
MSDIKKINAVDRAFIILEKLSVLSYATLEDIARETRLAKATVYRFLQTLRQLGYVKKGDGDLWYLTLKLFSVGSRGLEHVELTNVARPICEKLSRLLGETVHLGILDGTEAVYVLKIESKYSLRMHSRVGKHIPLYCTAIGKVLLAFMDDKCLAGMLNKIKIRSFTVNTKKDIDSIKQELDDIKSKGYAEDREEYEEGIRCISCPIFDFEDKIIAAISVSWPVFRFDDKQVNFYLSEIKKAASEISSIMGYMLTE